MWAFLLVFIFQFCGGGCVVPSYGDWEERRQKLLLRYWYWYLRKSHGFTSFMKTMFSNHYVKKKRRTFLSSSSELALNDDEAGAMLELAVIAGAVPQKYFA